MLQMPNEEPADVTYDNRAEVRWTHQVVCDIPGPLHALPEASCRLQQPHWHLCRTPHTSATSPYYLPYCFWPAMVASSAISGFPRLIMLLVL